MRARSEEQARFLVAETYREAIVADPRVEPGDSWGSAITSSCD